MEEEEDNDNADAVPPKEALSAYAIALLGSARKDDIDGACTDSPVVAIE